MLGQTAQSKHGKPPGLSRVTETVARRQLTTYSPVIRILIQGPGWYSTNHNPPLASPCTNKKNHKAENSPCDKGARIEIRRKRRMPGIVLTFPIVTSKVETWRRFCQSFLHDFWDLPC
jgi:hypothetical protein